MGSEGQTAAQLQAMALLPPCLMHARLPPGAASWRALPRAGRTLCEVADHGSALVGVRLAGPVVIVAKRWAGEGEEVRCHCGLGKAQE